jgi:hypothetical protein
MVFHFSKAYQAAKSPYCQQLAEGNQRNRLSDDRQADGDQIHFGD